MLPFEPWSVFGAMGVSLVGALFVVRWYLSPKQKLKRRLKREERGKKRAAEAEKANRSVLSKLRELKEGSRGIPAPPTVQPPGLVPLPSDINTLEEYRELHGDKIPYELTRLVAETAGKLHRITVMRGEVKITVGRTGEVAQILFIKAKKNLYYVNPRKLIKVTVMKGKKSIVMHKLEYDILYAEGMDATGRIEWDDGLEMILADAALDQYVTIASSDLGFRFTPTFKRVLMFVGGLGFFIGLALNGSLHIVPITQIHWIP